MSNSFPRSNRELAGAENATSWVHGPFLFLVCVSVFFVEGPWAAFHGILLGLAGLLMLLRPMSVSLSRWVWLMALGFLVLACASFLPVEWFGVPEWRQKLAALGVKTGDLVVVQSRQAVEMLSLYALMGFGVLWMAGQRANPQTLRLCALGFSFAVAAYAVISKLTQESEILAGALDGGHFGFFPNRNHSATYLAMGGICGLGVAMQSGRDKSWLTLGSALVTTAVIFWAIFSWSVSRAGVVLAALGLVAWLLLLGRNYLGRHGLWAIGLILLGVIGSFVIVESSVKNRISETIRRTTTVVGDVAASDDGKSALQSLEQLDFRASVYLDALEMIGSFPLTGVGAGQFHDVFPQYRKRTMVAQDTNAHHPDSDWLWLAAELGVPAALALLTLLLTAGFFAVRAVLAGRDRAVRAACLVAALLVPIHGLFDVPGHRISLAWAAALLFSMSIPAQFGRSAVRRWPSRLIGALLVCASAFWVDSQWFAAQPTATAASQVAIQKVEGLHSKGNLADKKFKQSFQILDQAKSLAPLSRELLRYEAFVALHFKDEFDRAECAMAIDRVLHPSCVLSPLRQGEAWATLDAERAVSCFDEALRRAKRLELLDPSNRWNSARVQKQIDLVASHNAKSERGIHSAKTHKRPSKVILKPGFPLGKP